MDTRELTDRIWDAVPVTQPAFAKLLGLLEIEISDAVPTAAVTTGARSRLLLNPVFVARHCRTRERLAMLVMHELMHVLLGHTRLVPRITPAQNWAFDAVINAHLCRQFPAPHWTALFRGCYRADRFPEALLRPPEGWGGARPRWRLRGEAGRVHRALYDDVSVTCRQLFDLLQGLDRADDAGGDGVDRDDGEGNSHRDGGGDDARGGPRDAPEAGDTGVPLLGDHGPGAGALDPDLLHEVRNIVARWPMDAPRSGRDQGGEVRHVDLARADPRRDAVAVIRRALWPLLAATPDGAVLRPATQASPAVLAYRTGPDRRAGVREAIGETPLFHAANVETHTLARAGRTRVYLDVSGSMLDILPLVAAALHPLRDWLHPAVHQFSTRVYDVSLRVLALGGVRSTLGTEIGCVTAHMLDRRVERAVVLTDGWVGDVAPADARALRRRGARVHGVITHGGDAAFLRELRGRAYRLPQLS